MPKKDKCEKNGKKIWADSKKRLKIGKIPKKAKSQKTRRLTNAKKCANAKKILENAKKNKIRKRPNLKNQKTKKCKKDQMSKKEKMPTKNIHQNIAQNGPQNINIEKTADWTTPQNTVTQSQ